MHWLSTTVQLIGTVVTAFGLFYSYGRATRLPARLREWWERVRRKPRNITIAPPPALIRVELLAPDVYTGFKLGEDATTDEKFAQLESYVQELCAMFGPTNAAIVRLGKAIRYNFFAANRFAARCVSAVGATSATASGRLGAPQSPP
jgi:hypothetical protein